MTSAEHGPFRWRAETQDGRVRLVLAGDIDENCDLRELLRAAAGQVEFDLEGIARINSCGVREWVNFMRSLAEGVSRVTFARCSPSVVMQLNTVDNFRGSAEVVSLLAPYACEQCKTDEYCLLDVATLYPNGRARPPALPAFGCDRCGTALVFDELPERYLSFLNEAP